MKSPYCNYFCFNAINLMYLLCGVGLVAGGIVLLSDTERVLISRLIPIPSKEPLLYYFCLAVLFLGLLVTMLSTLGCWATFTDNYCLLSVYIFGMLLLIIGESVMGVVTAICPEYFGLILRDDEITDLWQRNYGVPGKEQYTAAIDLIQSKMECCGVHNGNDFATSWWKIRELAAPNLTVPLSCCFPDKRFAKSFLDPVPANTTLCQDTSPDKFRVSRFTEGCLTALEKWLSEQKWSFLLLASTKLALQLSLIFSLIFACSKKNNQPVKYISSTASSSRRRN